MQYPAFKHWSYSHSEFSPQSDISSLLLHKAKEEETSYFMLQVGINGLEIEGEVVTIKQRRRIYSFQEALIRAVENNDKRVLSFLLELNTSPDTTDEDNWTALMVGSSLENTAAVELLLRAGANPNLHSSDDKESPLILACKNDHAEIAHLLVNAGANPNAQVKNGMSALFVAVSKKNSEVAKMLLSNASVNINLKDDFGETVLHVASKAGNTEAVILLLTAMPIQIRSLMLVLLHCSRQVKMGILKLLVFCLNHVLILTLKKMTELLP